MTLLPVDVQIREDAALGAAWRRCEAALPEGYDLTVVIREKGHGPPVIWAQNPRADVYDPEGEYVVDNPTLIYGYGPTPTAALEALADKLESLP